MSVGKICMWIEAGGTQNQQSIVGGEGQWGRRSFGHDRRVHLTCFTGSTQRWYLGLRQIAVTISASAILVVVWSTTDNGFQWSESKTNFGWNNPWIQPGKSGTEVTKAGKEVADSQQMESGSSTIHGMYLCNCVLDEMWMEMGKSYYCGNERRRFIFAGEFFVVELIPVVGADNLA